MPRTLFRLAEVELKVNELSCTEAWIQIKFTNIILPCRAALEISGKPLPLIQLNTSDTLIYLDSLLPGTEYSFSAKISDGKNSTDNTAGFRTLDTSSHQIIWQTYEFGDDNSRFNDVAILNDDSVLIGGALKFHDSVANTNSLWYGLSVFNGNTFRHEIINGSWFESDPPQKLPISILSISVTNNGDIFIAGFRHLFKKEKSEWIEKALFEKHSEYIPAVLNIRAVSPDHVICVGYYGGMYLVNGIKWVQKQSGTNRDIHEIWRLKDKDGSEVLMMPASSSEDLDMEIITMKNDEITGRRIEKDAGHFNSVWGQSTNCYYAAGTSLYKITNGNLKRLPVSEWGSITKIRGTGLNNIFMVNVYGGLYHFNGMNWHLYTEILDTEILYHSVAVNKNIVIAVGEKGKKAFVAFGKIIH